MAQPQLSEGSLSVVLTTAATAQEANVSSLSCCHRLSSAAELSDAARLSNSDEIRPSSVVRQELQHVHEFKTDFLFFRFFFQSIDT